MITTFRQTIILLGVAFEQDDMPLAIPFEMSVFLKTCCKKDNSIRHGFEEIVNFCLKLLSEKYNEINKILDLYHVECKMKFNKIEPRYMYSAMLPICIGFIQLFHSLLNQQNSRVIISGSGRLEKNGNVIPATQLNLKRKALEKFIEGNHLCNYLVFTHKNFNSIWEVIYFINLFYKLSISEANEQMLRVNKRAF